MKRVQTLLLFLFLSSSMIFAQDDADILKTRKGVYLDFLGGTVRSLNYDARFKPGQQDGLGFRAGVGGATITLHQADNQTEKRGILTIPLEVNYLVGRQCSGFEAGIGAYLLYASLPSEGDIRLNHLGTINRSGTDFTGYATVGYRLQPLNKGLLFRVNWTPTFNEKGFHTGWIGLSFGYSFK